MPRTKELDEDLYEMAGPFIEGDTAVPLMRERVQAFIKRVEALTENREHMAVSLSVADNDLTLSFAEEAATSDEWYPVSLPEGTPDLPVVKLDARRLARALAHSDELMIDHLERKVLVLRNKTKTFHYIIEGRV